MATSVKIRTCRNCRAEFSGRNAGAYCPACRYWQRKATLLRREICDLSADPVGTRSNRAVRARARLRTTCRVLEELRWREDGRKARVVDAARVQGLAYALAAAARTQVDQKLMALLSRSSSRSLKVAHDLLLSLLENMPERRPILHRDIPFVFRGHYGGGWLEWSVLYWALNRAEQTAIDQACLKENPDALRLCGSDRRKGSP